MEKVQSLPTIEKSGEVRLVVEVALERLSLGKASNEEVLTHDLFNF